ALHQARCAGFAGSEAGWSLQRQLVEHLAEIWEQPDEGIWEVRGGRRHFTHSKMMAWVALDRTVRTAEELKFDGSTERWRALRPRIHAYVCPRRLHRALAGAPLAQPR